MWWSGVMWCAFTVSDCCWLLAFQCHRHWLNNQKTHCNQNWQWVKKKSAVKTHQHKRLVVTGHTGPDQESSLAFCSRRAEQREETTEKQSFHTGVSHIWQYNKVADPNITGSQYLQKYLTFPYANREAAQLIQARASSPHFCRVMVCSAWLQNPTVRFITETKGTVLQMAGINGSFTTSAVSRIGSKIN